MKFRHILFLLIPVLLGISCSTKKNTASTRRWQSFVTRYNVYFNAEQSYLEGRTAQDKGLKENYTERLPIFGVGYEKQRSLGKSNFENAVTKCEKAIQLHSIKKKPASDAGKAKTAEQKQWLSRKEFNPFLKNAWLLMGKAQFQKGDFTEAAATFSYITRFYAPEPAVVAEARIWLARCYAEMDWFYDAEDVIRRMDRDTMPQRLAAERALTLADWHIRQEHLEEALPHLQRAIKGEKGKARRARLYYLLAQTYMALERKDDAYKALGKCISNSPSYEMTFHARILQTEAITNPSNAKSMVKRLRRMAKSDNNKDYLDQVYYAIGNIHMTQGDTLAAITAYETGRSKATQRTLETAVLLLRLGDIYWDQRRFDKAQPCFTEAIGLIDKEFENYDEITRRSKVLDALVPPTTAIHLQDSLQWLAIASESERLAAIDRVITELKKKEEEERKAKRDSAAAARRGEADQEGENAGNRAGTTNKNAQSNASKEWYFYNVQLVNEGKQAFKKAWGNRKNEDDWRRSNRTILANTDNEGYDYAAADSIEAAKQAVKDSLAATGMSERDIKRWFKEQEEAEEQARLAAEEAEKNDPVNDPHQREYYLAQIPFTPEQKAESDSILRQALFDAAVVEKDQLEDFGLAAETFLRLERQFPQFTQLDEACYHMFLLYSRWSERERAAGRTAEAQRLKGLAEQYRERMRTVFPEHAMTSVICDPDYEHNTRYGREIEDSLYTLAYDAYRRGDRKRVEELYQRSTKNFPKGLNRPKFMFVNALSQLGTVPSDSIESMLKTLVQEYPKSDVAEMAGMIAKGLASGREIGSGTYDIASLWNRRTEETEADNAASGTERALSPDRDVPFVFLIAYPTGEALYETAPEAGPTASDDMLLYNLARFNFSAYVFRGFDIVKERQSDITQFRVTGFRSFDDVHSYAQRIFHDKDMAEVLRKTRIELISEKNLQKLGSLYTYEDYRQFYDSCFVPLDITAELPEGHDPEDEAADNADYEETLPDASLYTKPTKNTEGEDKSETGENTSEEAGNTGDTDKEERNEDEEFYEEDDAQPKDSETFFIDEEAEKPASRQQTSGDDEIVIEDTPAKPLNNSKQTSNDDEIVIEDTPAKPLSNSQQNSNDDEIVIEDTPAKPLNNSKQNSNDDEIVIEDTPAKPLSNSQQDAEEEFVVDDTPAKDKPKKKAEDEEEFIIDDAPVKSNAQQKGDDEEEFVIDDTP